MATVVALEPTNEKVELSNVNQSNTSQSNVSQSNTSQSNTKVVQNNEKKHVVKKSKEHSNVVSNNE
jgi:hypothetical protein